MKVPFCNQKFFRLNHLQYMHIDWKKSNHCKHTSLRLDSVCTMHLKLVNGELRCKETLATWLFRFILLATSDC